MKNSKVTIFIVMFFLIRISSLGQEHNLALLQEYQDTKAWCWAACTSSILNYFGFHVTQCEIADYKRLIENKKLMFYSGCCSQARLFTDTSPCNDIDEYGGQIIGSESSIEGCLDYFGTIGCEYVDGVISFEDIKEEIDHGRPIIVGWWEANNGHTVVVTGYKEPNTVNVMDPWSGDNNYGGLMSYDALVQNIRYTWIATLKISCIDEITIGGNISATTGTEFIYEAGSNIQFEEGTRIETGTLLSMKVLNEQCSDGCQSPFFHTYLDINNNIYLHIKNGSTYNVQIYNYLGQLVAEKTGTVNQTVTDVFIKKVAYGVYTSYATVTNSCGKTRTLESYPVIIYE